MTSLAGVLTPAQSIAMSDQKPESRLGRVDGSFFSLPPNSIGNIGNPRSARSSNSSLGAARAPRSSNASISTVGTDRTSSLSIGTARTDRSSSVSIATTASSRGSNVSMSTTASARSSNVSIGPTNSDRSSSLSAASSSSRDSRGSDSSYRPISPLSRPVDHKSLPANPATSRRSGRYGRVAPPPPLSATTDEKTTAAPPSPTQPRKRSSAQRNSSGFASGDDYGLPPPPTRARKIIQMNPKGQEQDGAGSRDYTASHPGIKTEGGTQRSGSGKGGADNTTEEATAAPPAAAGGRKKANGSTAASRKVARKTAHSLIERRRRSKMNEEFGVLKDMIPACAGQEMHKLAILQASIDYMQYLEKCVSDLKMANSKSRASSASKSPYGLQPRQHGADAASFNKLAAPLRLAAEEEESDVEGQDDDEDAMSEAATPSAPPSAFTVISPVLLASVNSSPGIVGMYDGSSGAAGGTSQFSRQPALAPLPSPVFNPQQHPAFSHPQQHHHPNAQHQHHHSTYQAQHGSPSGITRMDTSTSSTAQSPATTLPSPTLLPEADHEATAALMMLGTDRRSWDGKDKRAGRVSASVSVPMDVSLSGSGGSSERANSGVRGMSVRDLLSGN